MEWFFSSPQHDLMEAPGERREEDGQGHDQPSNHRRQPRRLPPAERHQKRRQEVGEGEVGGADPNWKGKLNILI